MLSIWFEKPGSHFVRLLLTWQHQIRNDKHRWVGKVLSEKMLSDKILSEKVLSEKILSEKVLSDAVATSNKK